MRQQHRACWYRLKVISNQQNAGLGKIRNGHKLQKCVFGVEKHLTSHRHQTVQSEIHSVGNCGKIGHWKRVCKSTVAGESNSTSPKVTVSSVHYTAASVSRPEIYLQLAQKHDIYLCRCHGRRCTVSQSTGLCRLSFRYMYEAHKPRVSQF